MNRVNYSTAENVATASAFANRMRKIYATLGVILSLAGMSPASQAQVQGFLDTGTLICSLIPETNTGQVTIRPPSMISDNPLLWFAAVHHYDASSVYTNTTWTNVLVFTPSYLTAGWTDPATGLGTFVTPAHPLGYVVLQQYMLDQRTQQWIFSGYSGPQCLVFTSFAG